jgi:hypothetical protein
MAQEWWQRLPAAQRKVYERSAQVGSLPLKPAGDLAAAALEIERALGADDRESSERAAQRLVDRLCAAFSVATVRVRVSGVRPHDRRGELHGLYVPANGPGHDTITVWMRTARRGDVVKIKTFLRTLLHEVCHHLDYSFLDLPYSFHTQGFYRRESSLFRAVAHGTGLAARRKGSPRPPAALVLREPVAAAPRMDDAQVGRAPSGIALLRSVAAAIAARQKPDQEREHGDREPGLERAERAGLAQAQDLVVAEDDDSRPADSRKRVPGDHT